MRRLLIWIMLITMPPSVALAEPELKGSPDDLSKYLSSLPREVTLSGEAEIKIQSISGMVTIGIRTEDPKLQASLRENQKLKSEIIVNLINQSVSQGSIRGTRFSSIPEYGLFSKKPSSYVVESILIITVENESDIQKVAGIVDTYKNVFYHGFELKERAKAEIRRKLLRLALNDAEAKKKIYEEQLGVILKPIRFQENFSFAAQGMPLSYTGKGDASFKRLESKARPSANTALGEHVYHGFVDIGYLVETRPQE